MNLVNFTKKFYFRKYLDASHQHGYAGSDQNFAIIMFWG